VDDATRGGPCGRAAGPRRQAAGAFDVPVFAGAEGAEGPVDDVEDVAEDVDFDASAAAGAAAPPESDDSDEEDDDESPDAVDDPERLSVR